MEAEGLGAVVEGAEGEVVAAVARAAVARHVRLRLVLRRRLPPSAAAAHDETCDNECDAT